MKNYYQLSSEEVKQEINGKQEPLTSAEVKAHQEKFGPNELVEGKKKTTSVSYTHLTLPTIA